jgi:hypothetical protein
VTNTLKFNLVIAVNKHFIFIKYFKKTIVFDRKYSFLLFRLSQNRSPSVISNFVDSISSFIFFHVYLFAYLSSCFAFFATTETTTKKKKQRFSEFLKLSDLYLLQACLKFIYFIYIHRYIMYFCLLHFPVNSSIDYQ